MSRGIQTLAADAAWAALPFVTVGIVWEVIAVAGVFPAKLFPDIPTVAAAFLRLLTSGILWANTEGTLIRLSLGFLLAAFIGLLVGFLMGRYQWVEDLLLPLVSVAYPIPGLAYAPLFVLWFGLGDLPTVLLVGISSCFTIILAVWKGVKDIKPLWLRAAQSMGASERQIFHKVIIPASMPHVLTGLRLGLAQSWRILIAVEMITAVAHGLGWMIYGAQEFINTDVMLCGIAVIAALGLLLEKQVFARIERYTLVRWGMLTA